MNLHQLRQRKAELRSATSAIIASPGGTDGLLSDEQRTSVNDNFAELDRLLSNETCGSACKKDPLSGVIGVQQGPLISMV